MARGRFLDKRTATDERLATVSLKANYLYLALTPFFDIDGKHTGNVTLVKAAACPLRRDISEKTVAKCLKELNDAGLIEWYTVDGIKVVRMCDFKTYQKGLDRSKEEPIGLPDPNVSNVGEGLSQRQDNVVPATGQQRPLSISLSLSKREVEGKVEVKEQEQEQVEAAPLVPSEAEPRGSALSVETDDFAELPLCQYE